MAPWQKWSNMVLRVGCRGTTLFPAARNLPGGVHPRAEGAACGCFVGLRDEKQC